MRDDYCRHVNAINVITIDITKGIMNGERMEKSGITIITGPPECDWRLKRNGVTTILVLLPRTRAELRVYRHGVGTITVSNIITMATLCNWSLPRGRDTVVPVMLPRTMTIDITKATLDNSRQKEINITITITSSIWVVTMTKLLTDSRHTSALLASFSEEDHITITKIVITQGVTHSTTISIGTTIMIWRRTRTMQETTSRRMDTTEVERPKEAEKKIMRSQALGWRDPAEATVRARRVTIVMATLRTLHEMINSRGIESTMIVHRRMSTNVITQKKEVGTGPRALMLA